MNDFDWISFGMGACVGGWFAFLLCQWEAARAEMCRKKQDQMRQRLREQFESEYQEFAGRSQERYRR